MASLTGQTIASSYEQLLSLPDDGGNGTTLVAVTDGDGGTTFSLQLATTKTMINGSGNKLYFGDEDGEHISSDTTDLTIASGRNINLTCASGDVVIPANIGLTFGTGEKIEGDDTDLTVTSGGAINLTAITDVNIPSGVGLTFATAEKIESDGTDLTFTVGAGGDINIGSNIGLTFGDDGEKIEGDGTDLTIIGNNIKLTATADVVLAVNTGLVLDGSGDEKIESDGTDISFSVGSNGDINIPANIGLTFGDDAEKIEGNGTDLTIAGNNINLTAVADVVIPNNVGIQFGGASEKIEGDGTDLTISANNLTIDAAADIELNADGGDITFKDASTTLGAFDSSGHLKITGDLKLDDGGSITEADGTAAFTFDGSGNVTKIGQDSPGENEVLVWDGSKAVWATASSTGVSADSMPCDDLTPGDAAVNLTTSTGDITLDTDDGDIYLKADNEGAGTNSIHLTDGSTTRFSFALSSSATLNATGDFTLDGSADIILDADGGDWIFKDAGTSIFTVTNATGGGAGDAEFKINTANKDFVFKENDNLELLVIGEANGVYYSGLAGSNNTLYGKDAGKSLDGDCERNVFIGEIVADSSLVDAEDNVGVGYSALSTLTSGKTNVGVGSYALNSLTTGSLNVAIGHKALNSGVSPTYNVAIGGDTLKSLVSTNSDERTVAIGYNSMRYVRGSSGNIAIGYNSLSGSQSYTTTGISENIAIGTYAMDGVISNLIHPTEASYNIFIGYGAGISNANGNTTDGGAGKNIAIGYGARCAASNTQPLNYQVAIGYNVATDSDYQLRIGYASSYAQMTLTGTPSWSFASDERLKTNIEHTDLGLSFINELNPVKFDWKEDKSDSKTDGFIAQEVKEVMDKLGVSFSGWSESRDSQMDMDVQRLSYDSFVVPLVKAVQELSARVEHLEANNKTVTHIN